MKKSSLIILLFLVLVTAVCAQQKDYTEYVNPFIGTGGHGHTYPGACAPYGMVQLSPDTRLTGWDGCSAYHYSDQVIYGFSHTHLSGTGCSDYGDILLMPVSGDVNLKDYAYASSFSHKNEKAKPGYYAVKLDKHNIQVELTATQRAGMHRYVFAGTTQNSIILDLEHRDQVIGSYVEFVNNTTVRGMRTSRAWAQKQILYFEIQFSKPFSHYGLCEIDSSGNIKKTSTGKASGKQVKAFFTFEGQKEILVKIGLSATSAEGAAKNLAAEMSSWDFTSVYLQTKKEWNKELGKIEVEGGTKKMTTTFYSALYHCMITPNIYCDVDGKYLGRDLKVHDSKGSDYYTVFSLWDTYRAEHPLLTIIDQKRTNDFINTFISQYLEGGRLPVWELSANETFCMIGYHSVPVIYDAFAKGIKSYNTAKAYEAMKTSAMSDDFGLKFLKQYGYVPGDKEHESVSKTLEYAYDDWCIAQMAKALGKTDDYKKFIKRAQFYKNIFDTQTGFMRPKMNGAWQTPFDPAEVTFQYTEANAWQYSFYVPQDLSGLIQLYGGKANLANKLDELFNTKQQLTGREQSDITGLVGQYAHGNEPSHHMAYLYNYLNQPWKTQQLCHKIMTTLYHDKPDGLCGNEDCGQMSAWYVLSALGLYQVCPGNTQFAIGTPLFAEAVIHLENGNTFTIKAKKASLKKFYIQSAKLNEQPYTRSFLTYEDIMNGGKLEFVMGAKPNKRWGSADEDIPVTAINDHLLLPTPYVTHTSKTFTDSIEIELKNILSGTGIYYTTDGTQPDKTKTKYEGPFTIKETAKIKAVSFNPAYDASYVMVSDFIKINLNRKIKLLSKYSSQYTGGGDNALIDGIRGGENFRLGEWQGYDSVDFEAIVDLGNKQKINTISTGFLQDIGSWIWMPVYVEYSVSDDGVTFKPVAEIKNTVPINDYKCTIHDLTSDVKTEGRYVKVKAYNIGTIPEWHLGAGYSGWIFVDEIMID
ncbi:MAG TPA: GH92 family glycosyl hydrolase [Bacteroidales bacterium]|nr:GH92 family glycosyl hydrolase [Bacteroidales bacterium]